MRLYAYFHASPRGAYGSRVALIRYRANGNRVISGMEPVMWSWGKPQMVIVRHRAPFAQQSVRDGDGNYRWGAEDLCGFGSNAGQQGAGPSCRGDAPSLAAVCRKTTERAAI